MGANYASTRGGLSRAAKSAALQRGYANSDWSIEASMGEAHDGRRGASAHERALDALLLRAVDELRTADGRQRMPARAISQARAGASRLGVCVCVRARGLRSEEPSNRHRSARASCSEPRDAATTAQNR